MPEKIGLDAGFDLPFQEQVDFFRNKLTLGTRTWQDIMHEAHDRAFVVAGAMKADLLADLRRAVDRAITQGTSLKAFREDFKQIVFNRGWTGWTGAGSAAGEAWRTKVIWETNLRASYAAGRWAQLNDPGLKKLMPYWRYVHADSVMSPRPQHLAWGQSRLTLPSDHPFWKTHFPPNGWGCRCRVTAVAAPKAGDATEPPDGWDVLGEDGTLPGVDKGWGYAPGSTWHPDLDKYPAPIARQIVADNMRDGVFERWQARIAAEVAAALQAPEFAGLGKAEAVRLLREQLTRGEEYPVAIMAPDKQALIGVTTQVVRFSDYDAIKQAYSRMGDANFTADAYRGVQDIMDRAELIVREGDQPTVWFRDASGRLHVAIIWQTATGRGVFLKSLRFGGERDMRRARMAGKILYEG